MAWVKANERKIELIFLPAYAPERNPDEFLNNDVKQAMGRRKAPKDKAGMKQGLTSLQCAVSRSAPARFAPFSWHRRCAMLRKTRV